MNCLTTICYVCLEKKDKSLITINSSLSITNYYQQFVVNEGGYSSHNRLSAISLECCRRLRETYQLLAMCHKNSALMQGYMAQLLPCVLQGAQAL